MSRSNFWPRAPLQLTSFLPTADSSSAKSFASRLPKTGATSPSEVLLVDSVSSRGGVSLDT
eukprot:10919019-Alexandrium_andersonii.AAC.1